MRKPKVIPEGFIWDSIHKQLIDTRCNNPKLKKLAKNSILIKGKEVEEDGYK